MNLLNIEVSDSITPEFALPIESGLNQYNDEAVGFNENKPLAIVVRDEHGVVVGGMLGRTYLGLLFIDLIYLASWCASTLKSFKLNPSVSYLRVSHADRT
ncbi:hypothetical protein [Pantoea rodasii]|uniref:hypothetical protein n=1 Tax=Pantoea rodasii TaxID=1076549 RepID=UPI00068D1872|nr:hypothetical protein [Pantoea rodasii]